MQFRCILECSIAISKEHARMFVEKIAAREIGNAVLVEVPDRGGERAFSHVVVHSRLECAVAVAQIDAHGIVEEITDQQVLAAVCVEIPNLNVAGSQSS